MFQVQLPSIAPETAGSFVALHLQAGNDAWEKGNEYALVIITLLAGELLSKSYKNHGKVGTARNAGRDSRFNPHYSSLHAIRVAIGMRSD